MYGACSCNVSRHTHVFYYSLDHIVRVCVCVYVVCMSHTSSPLFSPTAEEPELDIDPEELAADKAAFKLEEGGAGKTD